MDITLQPTETWTAEDRSWLGSRDGTEVTQTITLDTSAFTEATHFPNGYIPSGTILGKVTATGLYGPYNNSASDGTEVAVGFLFSATKVRTGGPDVGAAIHWRGVIRAARLPRAITETGGLDAAARTDLAAKFWIR